MDFAGEVEAIGAGVASFAPGDRVFGMSPDECGAHMEAGEFRAVIDREYPLEAIADAYPHVETGQKTGIVVINVVPAAEHTRSQPPIITSRHEA